MTTPENRNDPPFICTRDPIVIVTGNVLSGITLWGPFVTIDDARSWADAQGLTESWSTRLFSPESVE